MTPRLKIWLVMGLESWLFSESICQYSQKKLGVMLCAWDVSTVRQRQGDPWNSLASLASLISEINPNPCPSEGPCFKMQGRQGPEE